MKRLSIRAGVLAFAFGSAVAQASEPANVVVSGRIIPAAQCTTTLSPAVMDYGAITDLNRNGPTFLDLKTMHLDVSCNRPARFAVRFLDHRSDDAAFISQHPSCKDGEDALCSTRVFGLGRNAKNERIGLMNILNGTDGKSADWIPMEYESSEKQLASRATGCNDRRFMPEKAPFAPTPDGYGAHYQYHIRIPGTECTGDDAQAHYHLPFLIAPAIDSEHLSIDNDIKIDGAFTMEIILL